MIKKSELIKIGIRPFVIGRIHSYISIMTGYPNKGLNDIEFSTDILYSDYSIRRVVCHFTTRRIPLSLRHILDKIQHGKNAEYVNVTCVFTGNAIPMVTIKIKQPVYFQVLRDIRENRLHGRALYDEITDSMILTSQDDSDNDDFTSTPGIRRI